MQFHFAPDLIRQFLGEVFVFEHFHAFAHARIIKVDALTRGDLRGGPVAFFKIQFRLLARGAEQAVMLVKAIKDRARGVKRNLR